MPSDKDPMWLSPLWPLSQRWGPLKYWPRWLRDSSLRLAGGFARALRGAKPSWWLLDRERPSRVLVVSHSVGERGNDRGRSLDNWGTDGERGGVLGKDGERGRGRGRGEKGKFLDREGERGSRVEDPVVAGGLSLSLGARRWSLGGQTLYLKG